MQTYIIKLADYDNPTVKNKAEILTKGHKTAEDKIAAIFYYVRDDIKFHHIKNKFIPDLFPENRPRF